MAQFHDREEPTCPNAIRISIDDNKKCGTTEYRNELYAGDDTSDMFGAPVPAPAPAGRDDAFRAHTMTWDNV